MSKRMHVDLVGCGLAATLLLGACTPEDATGYLEVKLSPASALQSFVILLDRQQVKPARGDSMVIRRSIGGARLELERKKDERVTLCDVVVKKNRVTTVTVHLQSGTLRCFIEAA